MHQNATPLRKSAPGFPNISESCVSCIAPATRHASFQILFKRPTPANVLKLLQNLHVLLTFEKVQNPLRLPRETTSERPNMVPACGVFNILTAKCASRHDGVRFSSISTSKSVPTLVCFVHFDLETRVAPQRRALFEYLNFQKCSICFWGRS